MTVHGGIAPAIAADVRRGERLEWWTLFWMSSVIVLMWLTMGASQAMKSAVIEDFLSLVPAIVFLLAARWERRDPNRRFPFGYRRGNSLAFLIAATALLSVGAFRPMKASPRSSAANIPPSAASPSSVTRSGSAG